MLFTTVADDAGLGIAALALTSTVLLLLILTNASTSRVWKIGSVIVAFAALTLAWKSMISVLGFPTATTLPADYEVLSTQVQEPDAPGGEAGAVFLWVRTMDDGTMPRAFAVPYTGDLHRRITSLERGQGRHQRMYGRGDGAGGVELYLQARRPPPKRQSQPSTQGQRY
jgi:hypothetical protein